MAAFYHFELFFPIHVSHLSLDNFAYLPYSRFHFWQPMNLVHGSDHLSAVRKAKMTVQFRSQHIRKKLFSRSLFHMHVRKIETVVQKIETINKNQSDLLIRIAIWRSMHDPQLWLVSVLDVDWYWPRLPALSRMLNPRLTPLQQHHSPSSIPSANYYL